jgi:hypothetical protein
MPLGKVLPIFDADSRSEGQRLVVLAELKKYLAILFEVATPQVQPGGLLQPIFLLSKLSVEHLHPMSLLKCIGLLSHGESNLGAMEDLQLSQPWMGFEVRIFQQVEYVKDLFLPIIQV